MSAIVTIRRLGCILRESATAGMLIVCTALAQRPPVQTALEQIRRKVDLFENKLADFVCRETIHSRIESDPSGQVEKRTTVELVFTGRQKHASFGGASFSEERKIEKIDGTASIEKEMPRGMFHVGGGYSSVLAQVFGKKGQENYSFEWAGGESAAPESLAIAFVTSNRKQHVKGPDGTHAFNGSGKAFFSPSTYEIERLEEKILPVNGDPANALTITVEFEPVAIGDEKFRMPRRVTAVAHRTV